jgi:hypothetical protein
MRAQLAAATSRQEPDERIGTQAQPSFELFAIDLRSEVLEQRVADEMCVDAGATKQLFLKGKHHGEPVHPPTHVSRALRMPRPHLGCDVIEDGYATALECRPKAKIEAW